MDDRLSRNNHPVVPTSNNRPFIDLNTFPEEHMTVPWEKSHDGNEKYLKPSQYGSCGSVADNGMYNVDETLYHAEAQMKIVSLVETVDTTLTLKPPTKRGPRARNVCDRLVERPEWLPLGWGFTWTVRTAGKTAGRVDKYFIEPSGQKFRSKVEVLHFLETGSRRKKKLKSDADVMPSDSPSDQRKKISKQPSAGPSDLRKKKPKSNIRNFSDVKFDFRNPPQSLTWVQVDDSPDEWAPISVNATVPESEKTEWGNVFSRVTQLDRHNGAS